MSDLPLLRMDLDARKAWLGDAHLDLRSREFSLLALLAINAGKVLTHKQIMQAVWRTEPGPSRTLVVHIRGLRKQLRDNAHHPRYITTIRDRGYRLETDILAAPVSLATPPISTEGQAAPPIPSEVTDLAEVLRASVAGLQAHVEARAAEIAEPRIKAAEREAAARVAHLQAEHADAIQRKEDLEGELRRQNEALERQVAQLRGRQVVAHG